MALGISVGVWNLFCDSEMYRYEVSVTLRISKHMWIVCLSAYGCMLLFGKGEH